MTKTVCIIQARRNSTRLPDKILLLLGRKNILTHVLERALAIDNVDEVILATTQNPADDALEEIALAAGASVYRGSEHDVLDRYYQAALKANATYVMRITSDCPLIDPHVCASLADKVYNENSDYGGNGSFPHGLDCEVFTMAALGNAHKNATSKEDREHVTLWMKRNPDLKKTSISPDDGKDYSKYRLTVDYPEDYELLEKIFAQTGGLPQDWVDIIKLLDKEPDLLTINEKSSKSWKKATELIYKKSTKL